MITALETERCRIRRFCRADVGEAALYLGDPAVMHFVEPPFDRDRTKQFIVAAGLCSPPLIYAVQDRVTSALLGHVIFHPWDDAGTWELGWILRRDAWGRGLATELTRGLICHGFEVLQLDRIIGECHPDNNASIRVLEKSGLRRAPELDQGLPVWMLSVDSPRSRAPRHPNH
ncbi:MAG: GNAT family N-acetyltransferase [Arachnia sp.]